MDTRLHQNQTVFGIDVLAAALQMLADGDGLLDQMVEILGDFWGHALRLEDSEDLVAGDASDLGDAVRVTQNHTDLRGAETLLGEFDDVLGDLLGCGLLPGWHGASVGQRRARDTLARIVHATHDCERLMGC